jgi:hypothetical protein
MSYRISKKTSFQEDTNESVTNHVRTQKDKQETHPAFLRYEKDNQQSTNILLYSNEAVYIEFSSEHIKSFLPVHNASRP